jgi:transcriptional regulator NrdR family protein
VDSNALILETRKGDDSIMRRRVCGGCGQSFVSREYTEAQMRLPASLRERRPVASNRIEPGPKADNLAAFRAWR